MTTNTTSFNGKEREEERKETEQSMVAVGPTIVYKEASTQTNLNIPLDLDIPDRIDIHGYSSCLGTYAKRHEFLTSNLFKFFMLHCLTSMLNR